ncbi:gliding motility-associated C-terminal domain-containing protein [Pontibacter sp. G13]|uniref:T9SS type B sorting domain-containing protein n=1 Tax=Pontibacter sp. G13 TaxID=3074898 RepID=UPI00288900B6|nr:gliding motility-associated C-terminal domain-containing protein [Pontibacter sp. G13]WNJ16146.1 gliding motility-associated C-terminal domain-containing protein [Pontibacter sp. G13]
MKKIYGNLLFLICSACLSIVFLGLTEAPATPSPETCVSYVPAAISPNGDGINDLFEIQFECEPEEFTIRIINEAHQIVYSSSDLGAKWDGSFEGVPLPEGYYQWELIVNRRGTSHTQNGELLLVR